MSGTGEPSEPGRLPPVRLGVVFDQAVQTGGGYQQSVNAALSVLNVDRGLCRPLFYTTRRENIPALRQFGIEAAHLDLSGLWRGLNLQVRRRLTSRQALTAMSRVLGPNPLDARFEADGVDLVYFLSPSGLAAHLERSPYLFTLWDLAHRDQPEFPEFGLAKAFDRREQLFAHALPRAVAVIAESAAGRDAAIRVYALDPERVVVAPFDPAQAVANEPAGASMDVRREYGVEDDYVLYPAQFWPHKNHVYLLRGLAELERRSGLRLWAILPGSDKGNLGHVKAVAASLGLAERVRFPGFVPEAIMPALYRHAVALVMPTYLGPTNLPPLEAFRLGTPVVYSDLPGLRDQVGEAALLVDLENPSDLAAKLAALTSTPGLRESLVAAGRRHAVAAGEAWLPAVLKRFRAKRATWPRSP